MQRGEKDRRKVVQLKLDWRSLSEGQKKKRLVGGGGGKKKMRKKNTSEFTEVREKWRAVRAEKAAALAPLVDDGRPKWLLCGWAL